MATLGSILPHIPLEALVVRMATTAFVVIAVAWAVGRFGPIIGGALAGLPMILGPGFYFLIAQAPADFVRQSAAYALLSLCATQLFVLAYIVCANRLPPIISLSFAVFTWIVAALLLRSLPAQPMIGIVLFAFVTVFCLRVGGRFAMAEASTKGHAGFGLLLIRGVLAGLLVAIVTTASAWLGPAGAGLILAFPIGYTVIAVTIHQTLGSASVIATLQSALLGTSSLAGFCATLAALVPYWPANAALGAALTTSVLITLGLVFRRPA